MPSAVSGAHVGGTTRKVICKTVPKYGKIDVDRESMVQRFARFGLEKEASESDSDEPSTPPVKTASKKPASSSIKPVITKELTPEEALGNSESSEPSKKSSKKKTSRAKKTAAAKVPPPEETEREVIDPEDTVMDALSPEPAPITKKASKKRASRAKKNRQQRAPSPMDVEMRSESQEPAMKSAVDALLPPLSVLRSMTPAEWIPRAVSEPRDKPPEVAKQSSPLNLSRDVAVDDDRKQKRRSSMKLPEMPELSRRPMSPAVVFSFAKLAATHDAPTRAVLKPTSSRRKVQVGVKPPTELMKSVSIDVLKRDPEFEAVPLVIEKPEKPAPQVDAKPEAEPVKEPSPMDVDTNATLEAPVETIPSGDVASATEPTLATETNENLAPPAQSRTHPPPAPQTRSISKAAANRTIDHSKLKDLSAKCDQTNPGPPNLCPTGKGRIRLEPLSKTNAPVFIEMSSDRFRRLMPKLPVVPLAVKK
uniref:Shugoshin_C domain-containing protein n=1 Tax=Panagrellus redivivus TaxID=6233 RepID=A0A7E5A0B9_PANRE